MYKVCVAFLLFAVLSGCQTTEQQAEDPLQWGRFDCKRLADGPQIAVEFDQAKAVCLNRAQAAGIAGTAAMPTGYGLGGAMVSGINRGITSSQIQDATIKSCMAERGYLLAKMSEHEARCPRSAPVAIPAPVAPKRKPVHTS